MAIELHEPLSAPWLFTEAFTRLGWLPVKVDKQRTMITDEDERRINPPRRQNIFNSVHFLGDRASRKEIFLWCL